MTNCQKIALKAIAGWHKTEAEQLATVLKMYPPFGGNTGAELLMYQRNQDDLHTRVSFNREAARVIEDIVNEILR